MWTSNFEMSVEEKQNTYLTKPRLDLGIIRREKAELGPEKSGLRSLRVIPS